MILSFGKQIIRFWYDKYKALQLQHVNVQRSLKGQSHEKVGEMSVEGDGLGPN
jgi:hypothetical protein